MEPKQAADPATRVLAEPAVQCAGVLSAGRVAERGEPIVDRGSVRRDVDVRRRRKGAHERGSLVNRQRRVAQEADVLGDGEPSSQHVI